MEKKKPGLLSQQRPSFTFWPNSRGDTGEGDFFSIVFPRSLRLFCVRKMPFKVGIDIFFA